MEVPEAISAHRSPAEVAGSQTQKNRPRIARIFADRAAELGPPRSHLALSGLLLLHCGSACGPVIVPVFKSKGIRVFNTLRSAQAVIFRTVRRILHLRTSRIASKSFNMQGEASAL